MINVLFHVLYLLGKCIYNSYRVKKPSVLHDIADGTELSLQPYDAIDEFSDEEDASCPESKTINRFYPPAYIQRYCAVRDVLGNYNGKLRKIVDFGCAELGFLIYLKEIPGVEKILCVDIDTKLLERCEKKAAPLISEMLSSRERSLKIEVCQGSVTDNDIKLKHADAVICIELIEHLYPDTLIDLPFNIFGYIKPQVVIITTPNVEFNVVFPNFSGYRHPDHKFEWTREQFQDWAQNIVVRYPYYSVTFHGICNGPEGTEELGALTQMAVFHRTLPINESNTEILVLDEYIQLKGQNELFKTVSEYDYHMRTDTRSDEKKILDEATYYINYLSYSNTVDGPLRNYEIYLERLLVFMDKYPVTLETLRSILIRAGWSVIDRVGGPAVLNPSEASSDHDLSDFLDDNNSDREDEVNDEWVEEYENLHERFTNEENGWDYIPGSPIAINGTPVDAHGEYLSAQNPHTENWHEAPNFSNEENRWDYESGPLINEIPAGEEHSSAQNPHTENWDEGPNFTNEHRWNYGSGLSLNEVFADEGYSFMRNLHTETWDEEPHCTNENRWRYKSGPVITEIPADADVEYLFMQNSHAENCDEEPNFTNEENRRSYESGPPIIEIPAGYGEEYLFMQNSHTENWHEELSIIIPENCSIIQENTYLFDGESSLVEFQLPEEPCATYDDTRHSKVRNTAKSSVFTERELPSSSISLVSNETEVEAIAQVTVPSMSSTAFNDSLQLKNSVDNVTIESGLLQNDQINSRTKQGVCSTSNFQPYMSLSRSSTSPMSLYLGSEMNNSLQDFCPYSQNVSYNNQCSLNSTFHQSEMVTETAINTEESIAEDTSWLEKSLSENDMQESEINSSLYMSPNYYNHNVEQKREISEKNQIFDDSDMADIISLDAHSSDNQPKYTSSPSSSRTKMSVTDIEQSFEYTELMPAMNSNNVSLDVTDEIKKSVSNTSSSSLEDNQKSDNSTTETIKPCATSSSSDITNTSSYNVEFSASNSTQQKSCLENKEFSGVNNSVYTGLMQDTSEGSVKNGIINHESDVMNDIQNIDARHDLSLDNESTDHKDKNAYCTLATALTKNHIDTEAHLENVISDLAQSSIRKKGMNPPRDLLSSKSQSVSKYPSSECAKESSILKNDRFVPCKSNEDSNIHFTSLLKSDETVGTSKDISNIAGLASNVEAKPSSPLETPPNSWSPEIMDSGYPNSASAQDITPEYDLSSIAQDHIPDSESPSVAEAPRLGVLEPIEVENGDLANNNRDDEGNNMIAVDANDIENLQPLIDVLENDLENENDIYVMQNGFPIWLLRILDMANPLDFDMQARQNQRVPDEVADDGNYIVHDEGFDSSSSESESDVAYNEIENDDGHDD